MNFIALKSETSVDSLLFQDECSSIPVDNDFSELHLTIRHTLEFCRSRLGKGTEPEIIKRSSLTKFKSSSSDLSLLLWSRCLKVIIGPVQNFFLHCTHKPSVHWRNHPLWPLQNDALGDVRLSVGYRLPLESAAINLGQRNPTHQFAMKHIMTHLRFAPGRGKS